MKLIVFLSLVSLSAGAQTLKDAIKFTEREQFSKSKETLKGLIKADPKNTDQYFYLGDVYLKNEQPDSARYWFMEAVKINENSALNYAGLGKVSMESNATEGKANFDKAISLAKKDGRVGATIAEYYLNLDKPDKAKAVEYALKGTEAEPKSSLAKQMLGEAYWISGEGSKAMEQYKAALALDPKSPATLWRIGKLYMAAKNYEVGIQNFKEGLVFDSLYSPIYRDLGDLYYRAARYDKAIASYKKYLEIRDKSDLTDFRYATFLFLNQDYTNSMNILDALIKKNYNNPVIYRLKAYSQFETKDYTNALQTMDIFWKKAEARKLITQDYEYYGRMLVKNGKDSLGVEYFNMALERDTSKKELYGEIANTWFAIKKYDKAAAAFEKKIAATKATAKSTTLANDYLNMGRSYLLNKNYTEADQTFGKLIELKPELGLGYIYRARANTYMDGPKQEKALAKPYYEKFIEIAKGEPEKNKKDLIEAYSYLGSYYKYVIKDKVKFDEAWNSVRVLDPTNKAAIEATKQ